MTQMDLRENLLVRLFFYLVERFKLFVTVPALILNFLLITKFISDEVLVSSNYLIIGVITFICYFILIRLLDEIKDFEHDSTYYKERPVQQGEISLIEIKLISFWLIFFLACLNLFSLHISSFIFFGALFGFLFLMFKEFFIGKFIKKNILLYTLLHQMFVPILVLYLFNLAGYMILNTNEWLFIILNLLLIFSGEISRKIRSTGQDNESKDSYSSFLGHKGASILAIVVLVSISFLVDYLFSIPNYFYITILLPLASLGYYLAVDNKKSSDMVMGSISIYLFILILGIIII